MMIHGNYYLILINATLITRKALLLARVTTLSGELKIIVIGPRWNSANTQAADLRNERGVTAPLKPLTINCY
jgi:hypothetical protein